MIKPNLTETIPCPCKNGGNAFKDSFDRIEVSLCSTCGLMTTSQYQEDSEQVLKIKELCPPEIMLQIWVTNHNNPLSSGAKTATTPIGSGTEKLK